MASRFDVDTALKWVRFDPQRTLAHRRHEQLPFASEDLRGTEPLLLDTCVYIDQLQRKSPGIVERLLSSRQVNHTTVVVQELMHAIGALDPKDGRTKAAVAEISGHIRAMPIHRMFAPDADVLGRAGLLSGIVSRLQGYGREQRLRALHDCVLFLQAQKLGLTVLTRDIGDFDVLSQLIPAGRVLFYRRRGELPV